MQQYNISYLFLMLFFSLTLHAEEIKSPSIQTLIEQVKTVKVKDRRVLMNQLKIQLREMNKENRQKAMMELKKSFSNKKHKNQTQHKHQTREHKNLHEQQSKHQPKYRHLQNGQGRGQGNGQGNGHK
jgi:hypothetical protein